jgi:hypothetical protein
MGFDIFFNQPILITFTIIFGLIFSYINYTLGWFLATVIVYELIIMTVISKSYNWFNRLTLNCVLFMTFVYGNWIRNGNCMMDNLIYGGSIVDESYMSKFVEWASRKFGLV